MMDKNLNADWAMNWQAIFTDKLLDAFAEFGFVVFDEVFAQANLQALQTESGYIEYKEANLTEGERLVHIRGDKTHWIGDNDQAGMGYLNAIEQLGEFCNRIFYTGIRHCEAHYACYPKGFGYQWHSDNPKGRDERVLSAVFYLNEDWQETDGGALELIDKQQHSHTLLPKANRLVLFDSNLQHQVQIANRERFSIATWLRRD